VPKRSAKKVKEEEKVEEASPSQEVHFIDLSSSEE